MSRRLVIACLVAASAVLPQAVGTPAASAAPVAAVTQAASSATVVARQTTAARTASPAMLRPGMSGPRVLALQTRLAKLGYWIGTPNGHYGHATSQAVMALQKVAGLERDGVAGPATQKALARGVLPKPRSTRGRVVEVDLRRQVLMFVVDGRLQYVVNTSTGATATPTPRGKYRIFRQYDGWRTAPLGKLYRPKYFHGGYAVHGVNDGGIPGRPASHGCTRVSMAAMDMMWGKGGLRYGDRVWVY